MVCEEARSAEFLATNSFLDLFFSTAGPGGEAQLGRIADSLLTFGSMSRYRMAGALTKHEASSSTNYMPWTRAPSCFEADCAVESRTRNEGVLPPRLGSPGGSEV